MMMNGHEIINDCHFQENKFDQKILHVKFCSSKSCFAWGKGTGWLLTSIEIRGDRARCTSRLSNSEQQMNIIIYMRLEEFFLELWPWERPQILIITGVSRTVIKSHYVDDLNPLWVCHLQPPTFTSLYHNFWSQMVQVLKYNQRNLCSSHFLFLRGIRCVNGFHF